MNTWGAKINFFHSNGVTSDSGIDSKSDIYTGSYCGVIDYEGVTYFISKVCIRADESKEQRYFARFLFNAATINNLYPRCPNYGGIVLDSSSSYSLAAKFQRALIGEEEITCVDDIIRILHRAQINAVKCERESFYDKAIDDAVSISREGIASVVSLPHNVFEGMDEYFRSPPVVEKPQAR